MATVMEIGMKLVELSSKNNGVEAVDTLYGDEIVSVEAEAMPGGQQVTTGKAAIRAKNVWWVENQEIHKLEVTGPWPHGDRFIVHYKIDCTCKAGPMAGKRMNMEEAALYTVKDGKIVKEEFFYPRHAM